MGKINVYDKIVVENLKMMELIRLNAFYYNPAAVYFLKHPACAGASFLDQQHHSGRLKMQMQDLENDGPNRRTGK